MSYEFYLCLDTPDHPEIAMLSVIEKQRVGEKLERNELVNVEDIDVTVQDG